MKPLTVIATLVAKPGQEEALAETLKGLLAPTRSEPGCINYDLHRSHDAPGTFVFTESWASKASWEAHMNSPHLQAFGAQQDALTASWNLFTGETV